MPILCKIKAFCGAIPQFCKGEKMTLGEIKLEALRLMFINMDKDITVDGLQDLYNDSVYSMYLSNMTGAINRAIDRIVAAKVLPMAYKKITNADGEPLGDRMLFNLPAKIDDFFDIVSVDLARSDTYEENASFVQMTNNQILVKVDDSTQILVVYNPKMSHIDNLQDTASLSMPDEIANLIPYYIKSDLYQEDNASLANDARNKFEAGLAAFVKIKKENNYKICKKFSMRFC